MADIPLIRNFDAGAAFAFRNRRPVRVEEFLGEVQRLADLLPDRRYVVNLCSDRYQFTVGLCAALLRRQVNLLPPNVTPDLLNRMSLEYPDAYFLSDGAVQPPQKIATFPPRPTAQAARSGLPALGDRAAFSAAGGRSRGALRSAASRDLRLHRGRADRGPSSNPDPGVAHLAGVSLHADGKGTWVRGHVERE